MNQTEKCAQLIRLLQAEMPEYANIPIPALPEERFRLFRSLVNLRPPVPASEEFLTLQDDYLREETRRKGVVDINELDPCPQDGRLILWQGDITRLRTDAIVNAANSQLLGCFSPCHGCIDNIIHTMSGVQLRLKCNELMRAQGHDESTGQAKITPGYNLPANYVLHTVGPIVQGKLTKRHEEQLASCYCACLNTAEENGAKSIAFCCISTGVFMFPNQRAAEIAVKTVREWLDKTDSKMQVIFNVFKDPDREIYEHIL